MMNFIHSSPVSNSHPDFAGEKNLKKWGTKNLL